MKAMQRWTQTEDEQLYELHGVQKLSIKACAELMRRSEHSVEARWRWLHVSEDQREKRRQREYARRRTLGMRVRGKSQSPDAACGKVWNNHRPPDSVFADRAARERAPRSLTAWICGDPAPGWSALDRRGT
jgi:hypothetical protein